MTAETWHELDGRTESERTPTRLRGPDPTIANILLGTGGAIILAVYVYSAAEPVSPTAFSGALFAGGLLVVASFSVKQTHKLILRGIEHQKALEWQHKHIEGEASLRNGQVATMVEQNNVLMRQLQAMPTVRMNEMREELRILREYSDSAVERALKRIDERFDELPGVVGPRLAEAYMDGFVDGASQAPNVVRTLEARRPHPPSS